MTDEGTMSTQSGSFVDHGFPATSLGLIRDHAPEAYRHLQLTYDQAYLAADPALLELARLRIAAMLDPAENSDGLGGYSLSKSKVGSLADGSKSGGYTPVERACIAFAEQFAFYVADVEDALIADLLRELPPAEVYGLVNGIYVVDAIERLRIVLTRIFGLEEGSC